MIAIPGGIAPAARVRRPGSRLRGSVWTRPEMVFAYIVLGLWAAVILAAPVIAPFDPFASTGELLAPPSASHLFGTDSIGRDVLSRTLYCARESLPVALGAILGAVVVGALLGAVAGFGTGPLDAVIMRIADMTMASPPILLAMAVAAALGPGSSHTMIAVIVVWWPIYARLMRGQVLSLREREHVEASSAIGASRARTLFRHILPHARTAVMVNATMDLGQIVILVASLSFLGLGAQPPSPDWGAMITDGAKNFYQPWIAAAPGIAILSVAIAVNFLGDGLRDAFDHRSHR